MARGLIKLFAAGLALFMNAPAFSADNIDPPWKSLQIILANLQPQLRQRGVVAVGDRVGDLQAALQAAPKTHLVQIGERRYALVDTGSQDIITQMLAADPGGTVYVNPNALQSKPDDWSRAALNSLAEAEGDLAKDKSVRVQLVRDPYPFAALLLGSYFNEIKRPDEALRWLDVGMALPSLHYQQAAAQESRIVSERGIALSALHRLAEVVAGDDAELTRRPLRDQDRARLLRNKAFALTDLGELDRAAAAYNESLTLEPNNAVALHELEYIRRLKNGNRPTETQLYSPGAKPPEPPKP